MGSNRIYLDYAAGTPVRKEARAAMVEHEELIGNPGAIHSEGVRAKELLEESRKGIASFLGCRAKEIIFTSGGTEGNNLAILGYAAALEESGQKLSNTHWITSSIEHPSVLAPFKALEKRGAKVSYVEPNEKGEVRASAIEAVLARETVFVSIGWANGEIGTVQSLHAISKILKEGESKPVLHTDAGQAPLYVASMVNGLGVDLMTLDSSKLYGPRGTGALFVRPGVDLKGLMYGGSQERGLRAGSENVLLSVGFAKALECTAKERKEETERVKALRETFLATLSEEGMEFVLNGESKQQIPNIANISIEHIQSEYTTLALDHRGIAVSTKSSCREGEESESHVVRALGGPGWRASSTLRVSFGLETREEDVREAARQIAEASKLTQS